MSCSYKRFLVFSITYGTVVTCYLCGRDGKHVCSHQSYFEFFRVCEMLVDFLCISAPQTGIDRLGDKENSHYINNLILIIITNSLAGELYLSKNTF